jgi:hyperosmotically inducible protein
LLKGLFVLFFLLALISAGLYYWHFSPRHIDPSRLGEMGAVVSDAKTLGGVKTALRLNRNLQPYDIGVSVENGVVTLRGSVPREPLVRAAEAVAGDVRGVRQVVNHLRVGGEARPDSSSRTWGESLDDETVEMQVKLALSLSRSLEGADIDVRSFRRNVVLSGELATEAQRALAVGVAKAAAGVAGVTDELRVRQAGGGAGGRRAAQRRLDENANLREYGLAVRETRGRLVVEGRVATGAERELAGLLAREAAGRDVENAITVGKP